MYAKETTIINRAGLQAKAASEFIAGAIQFNSDIVVTNLENGQTADGKSIISVIGLAVPKGAKVRVSADGDDEMEAVDNLIALIEDSFGLEE